MVEKSHPGKWKKTHYWKMTEWKMHTRENGRKITSWKRQKTHYWKMTEWKMHTLENGRKITSWKMEEKSPLENDRMENAHPGY